MHIVFTELLATAKNLEMKEAERLGENDDWLHSEKATEIYSEIFESIHTYDSFNDVVYERPITSWHHRSLHEFGTDLRSLGIHREKLLQHADDYLSNPWMRDEKLDYFLVNILIYAETQAYLHYVARQLNTDHVLPDYLVAKRNGFNSWYFIKAAIFFLFAYLAFGHSLLVGFIYIASIVVLNFYLNKKTKSKVMRIVNPMLATYASASSINLSWLNLWDELKRSKEAGVVWDSAIYSLVESKLSK